jgi:hypothetical protein
MKERLTLSKREQKRLEVEKGKVVVKVKETVLLFIQRGQNNLFAAVPPK